MIKRNKTYSRYGETFACMKDADDIKMDWKPIPTFELMSEDFGLGFSGMVSSLTIVSEIIREQ